MSSSSNQPFFSIIIPSYNVENYIAKCLQSVLGQSFINYEIIIVDDGSTDSSLKITQEISKNNPQIVIITQKNKGLGGARNTGIEKSTGQYLLFLDSDDWIKPTTLQKLNHTILNEDSDIVVYGYEKVNEHGEVLTLRLFGKDLHTKEDCFKSILGHDISPMVCNKVYRRNLFIDHAITFKEKFLHEDIPITYKLFWHAEKISHIQESFYCWFIREGSITQTFTFKHILDLNTTFNEIREFLINNKLVRDYHVHYIKGVVKMFNVIIDRAINNEKFSIAPAEYLIFIYNKEMMIKKSELEYLSQFEPDLINNFNSNLAILNNVIKNHYIDESHDHIQKIAQLEKQFHELTTSRKFILFNKMVNTIECCLPKALLKSFFKP
jgi:glycosyltransferase involved in cell wall biosynthesis